MCLLELKRSLQKHEFARIVTTVSEENPTNFNLLLTALHELNLSDYKGLTSCFMQSCKTGTGSDEYSLAAKYAAQVLLEDTTAAEITRKNYSATFVSGRFLNSIFSDQ